MPWHDLAQLRTRMAIGKRSPLTCLVGSGGLQARQKSAWAAVWPTYLIPPHMRSTRASMAQPRGLSNILTGLTMAGPLSCAMTGRRIVRSCFRTCDTRILLRFLRTPPEIIASRTPALLRLSVDSQARSDEIHLPHVKVTPRSLRLRRSRPATRASSQNPVSIGNRSIPHLEMPRATERECSGGLASDRTWDGSPQRPP